MYSNTANKTQNNSRCSHVFADLHCILLISCIAFISILFSCGNAKKISLLKEGKWRGILTLVDSTGLILPFNFDLTFQNDSTKITIHNAEEKIIVNEISFSNDSVFIRMPVFDSEFRCKISGDTLLEGNWYNHSRKDKNVIPFKAVYGETNRFDCPEYDKNFLFEGKWKCLFSPNQPDSSYAIGVFRQTAHGATGTFLTETGDYRYLEGCVFGNYMLLSCFDGSHAFVFHAQILEDSTIWGEFYSGIHHQETWLANKDSTFRLRNADSLTFLKKSFPKVDFTFPNPENKKVSLSDEKYKNKVVILQIMGSWCPNCMDETIFLSELYNKYKSQGVEIIGLCFEKADAFEKAKENVLRLQHKFNAGYDFLITGFNPKDADKALPMLNHVMSFPTTIIIDRKGNVRKIHTGYSGPATGSEHEKEKAEMISFIESLLKEKG
ncbi:MAG: TlpA family protein disulfide reductase [Bacteroidetes bacterium]|nr:TlpA family protein disulfide reductase [Bacteroidota bacterium]